MGETTGPFAVLAVASVSTLCLLVAGAGAVGIWAQFNNTWTHFFLMERTFSTLAPIVVAIGAVALITSIAAVLRTD